MTAPGVPSHAALLADLVACLGAAQVLTGADAEPYLTDWRRAVTGRALAVLRPGSCDEVAHVVRLCAAAGVPVVPQGGNTGQVAAATPSADGGAVVLSLVRMNRIRAVDLDGDTITVEAGCVLQAVQDAARQAGRLFPLSLGAEGSCTIGGNLATNAGGTQVLRYGNARELALGLEVVTPQGEIWHGLRSLRKDNTGYDLRDLYIGSEGTLGIITAAVLKLFPLPRAQRTALIVVPDLHAALRLLQRARAGFGAALTAFEVMAAPCLHDVVRAFPAQRLPFPALHDKAWCALLEISDSEDEQHAQTLLETVLAAALEAGEALDAVVAVSQAQSDAFWHLRESITLALAQAYACVKHDISLAASRIPDFVRATDRALAQAFPGVAMRVFGHLGDGNLHYNLLPPPGAREADIQRLVHDRVHEAGGSISAEQGIGQRRVQDLQRYKGAVELALMQRIKQALDPQGLMNPGKVLAADPPNT
ncbi:FAD-binding oxidoreductase [Achromobacter deleyi]|uniref:FAD-binding oxidoreductase n=1 Tax=Achromobacter deleyi TaxID=1353891 RepID=UPI001465E2CA|nr:FAD-binding oxidoreductase [Achromobacter deleyi]CAB3849586.1 putative FAD-linked oxidoreductase [Achromobacter deleyi]